MRLKIIYYGSFWVGYGGTETTLRTMLRSMAEKGYDVTAIITKEGVERNFKRPIAERNIKVLFPDNPLEKLYSLIDKDVVVYSLYDTKPIIWQKIKELGGHVLHKFMMSWFRDVGFRADNYVFNSQFTKSFYPEVVGKIIYPIIDENQFKDKNSERKYIGIINPIRVKGSWIIYEVAKLKPEWNFLFCGGWQEKRRNNRIGLNQQKIRNNRLSLNQQKNIKIIESIDDISDFYNQCEIFLLPTQKQHSESFGRVIIEAMYCGCPVIASYKDAIPEAMGGGGFLVREFENPIAWIKAINHVKNNYEFYKNIALQRAEEYKKDDKILKWENAFKEALK